MKIEDTTSKTAVGPRLARTADRLEQAFLAEMLKIAMPSGTGAFGGGIGESQFASFLTDEHAAALSTRLDLGLMARIEAHHG